MKHVKLECVCVVPLPHATEIQQLLHATSLIINAYVGMLEWLQLVARYLMKHAKPEHVCVELERHVMEMLKQVSVMPQMINVYAELLELQQQDAQ